MTVIGIEKDFDSLSLILVADFDAPIGLSEHDGGTRMEPRFVFYSSEHMRQFERWGTSRCSRSRSCS